MMRVRKWLEHLCFWQKKKIDIALETEEKPSPTSETSYTVPSFLLNSAKRPVQIPDFTPQLHPINFRVHFFFFGVATDAFYMFQISLIKQPTIAGKITEDWGTQNSDPLFTSASAEKKGKYFLISDYSDSRDKANILLLLACQNLGCVVGGMTLNHQTYVCSIF